MLALLCFVLAVLASPFKSKSRLEAENAALRHQLIVLRRKMQGRIQLTNNDRWFLAGGAMILALLATLAGLCLSGWLLTTDAFWGSAVMESIHETLANVALFLVGLHVAGVLWTSFRHRENLVYAMLTGRKRAVGPGDVA